MATATIDRADLARARDEMRNVRETRRIPFKEFELRAADGATNTLTFQGYACITETPYEMQDWLGPYSEIVRHGAFTKTLGEQADVAFLINHEGMTLARTKSGTLQLSEDDTGLLVVAMLDATNLYVQALRSAVERGDMDEMSFAFWVMRQEWSPDYEQRDILEVKLHQGDVSCVNFGANSATSGTVSMRHAHALRALRGHNTRALAAALTEIRAGKTLSASTTDVLQQILDLASDADDCVDQVQIILSDLMGVPNPDDDDQWDDLANGDGEGDTPPVGQGQQNSLSLARARLELQRALAI
jgi:HK97 family phage prohead protease